MRYRSEIARLASLCEIQTGYTVRSRLEPRSVDGTPGIQLRDLREEEEFNPANAALYALDDADRYRARAGDVLFRSRGEKNTAVVVAPESAHTAIAILPLLILRPKGDVIDSRYLTWFINQPAAQRHFDSCARGTGLRMIPRLCLEKLEIAVPDLATQRLVVEIDRLARRERSLALALTEKKRELTGRVLLEQVRKGRPVDQLHKPFEVGDNRASRSIAEGNAE